MIWCLLVCSSGLSNHDTNHSGNYQEHRNLEEEDVNSTKIYIKKSAFGWEDFSRYQIIERVVCITPKLNSKNLQPCFAEFYQKNSYPHPPLPRILFFSSESILNPSHERTLYQWGYFAPRVNLPIYTSTTSELMSSAQEKRLRYEWIYGMSDGPIPRQPLTV